MNAFHLGDIYGGDAQHVPDVLWLEGCGRRGYIVLTLDENVRRNAEEWDKLQQYGTKVFTVTARRPSESTIGLYVGRQIPNILNRDERPGPAYWRLRGDDVYRVIP